jgi:predicted ATPase
MAKKYLITGGPCAGKTSLLLALDLQGEEIIRETAEDFIRLQQARGIKEPYKSPDFQDNLLNLQISRELHLEWARAKRGFIDGGMPDFFVYYPLCGKKTPEHKINTFLEQHPYESPVFFALISKDKYEKTRVRRENLKMALEIENRLIEAYKKAGYDLYMIHNTSIDERVRKILHVVGKNG